MGHPLTTPIGSAAAPQPPGRHTVCCFSPVTRVCAREAVK